MPSPSAGAIWLTRPKAFLRMSHFTTFPGEPPAAYGLAILQSFRMAVNLSDAAFFRFSVQKFWMPFASWLKFS